MSERERLVQFELLGQAFSFYTGETEAEMQKILDLVRLAVNDKPQAPPTGAIPATKIAVLGCLTLASDYMKLQRDFELYKEASDGRIAQLGENIQRCLEDEA